MEVMEPATADYMCQYTLPSGSCDQNMQVLLRKLNVLEKLSNAHIHTINSISHPMATPTRHLCRTLFQISRRIPVKRKCQTPFLARQRVAVPFRQLSTTCLRRANDRQNVLFEADDDDDLEEPSPDSYRTPSSKPITTADLDASELADFNMLSPKDQVEYLALQNHYAAELEDATAEDAMDALVDTVDRQVSEEVEPLDFPDVPHRPGFWAEDEDDEFGQVEDDDDNPDDSGITSVAHSELDLHREVREYTRVIAWDMPLLQREFLPVLYTYNNPL